MSKSQRPTWENDLSTYSCTRCKTPFTIFVRKHHCRHCGKIYCANCSSKSLTLPTLQYLSPVRICDVCYGVLLPSRSLTATDVGRKPTRHPKQSTSTTVHSLRTKGVTLKAGSSPADFIENNDFASFSEALTNTPSSVHQTFGPKNQTLLHLAARHGRRQFLELLLSRKSIDPSSQDENGDTPLHEASRSDKPDAISVLVNHGANVNAANKASETPLHLACRHQSHEGIKELLAHSASTKCFTSKGYTPLHELADVSYCIVPGDVVTRLVNSGADVNVESIQKLTPLHVAARKGHSTLLSALIESGADVWRVDPRTLNTALHYACDKTELAAITNKAGVRGCVETLLYKDMSLSSAKNGNGLTPAEMGDGDMKTYFAETFEKVKLMKMQELAPSDQEGTQTVTIELHDVTVGDTLSGIALFYECSIEDIQRLNNGVDDRRLFGYKQVRVPMRCGRKKQSDPQQIEAFQRRANARKPEELAKLLGITLEQSEYYLSITDYNFQLARHKFEEDIQWEAMNRSGQFIENPDLLTGVLPNYYQDQGHTY
eukprot:TRINITY_DN10097_c0_g1_i1.p1 TRINITY_DN10097_c0_g1~~TRINITY_DN10097_c0_g1_i1.p1  ORF type:complete len:545 (+),score=82.98 TRINITY_DN10097_c0_g1_i1:114-1748(+)